MKLFSIQKYFLLFLGLLSFCLMCSLVTFHPFDDTYFQCTGNDFVYNAFGKLGALFADILFFVFGCMAYLFSCMIFLLNWICFFKNRSLHFSNFFFQLLGSIILLFSSCGLIEFFVDDFYYCFSGGIVGNLLRSGMLCMFNDTIVNIVLMVFLVLGFFLLYGRSYHLCKKNFLNLIIKLESIKNKFEISISKFLYWFNRFNKYFRQIKNVQIRRTRIRYQSVLKKMLFYIYRIICNFKYTCCFFTSASFGKKYVNSQKYYDFQSTQLNCYNSCSKESTGSDLERLQKSINNKFMLSPSFLQTNIIKPSKKEKLFRKGSEKRLKLLPDIDLLSISPVLTQSDNIDIIKTKSKLLELKLAEYHIQAHVVNILQGPVVTRFELDLAPGLKSSRIFNLSCDLARSLSVCNLKVIEIIPGKPYIGIDIPNEKREVVYLREILDSEQFRTSYSFLTLGFGKDVSGVPVVADLIDMPHLLIAGTTGSGKSVGIHSMIVSILYKASPEDVRFIMIDSKILELSIYNDIPHLVTNVVTDVNTVIDVLNWCVKEMERRYKVMARCGVRNLKRYNDRVQCTLTGKFSIDGSSILLLKKLPYIVIIIDEFADLVLVRSGGKKIESLIIRLSQKARACGMHLVLATQRPSVNVITGLIKANIPNRIAFTVSSKVDSCTILDRSGAELLLGRGDMLYLGPQSFIPIRIHGAFVSGDEVSLIVKYWKNIFNKNDVQYEYFKKNNEFN